MLPTPTPLNRLLPTSMMKHPISSSLSLFSTHVPFMGYSSPNLGGTSAGHAPLQAGVPVPEEDMPKVPMRWSWDGRMGARDLMELDNEPSVGYC